MRTNDNKCSIPKCGLNALTTVTKSKLPVCAIHYREYISTLSLTVKRLKPQPQPLNFSPTVTEIAVTVWLAIAVCVWMFV